MIDVADGITSVEVGPDEMPHLIENALMSSASQERPPGIPPCDGRTGDG